MHLKIQMKAYYFEWTYQVEKSVVSVHLKELDKS